jgi:uncharacterized protein
MSEADPASPCISVCLLDENDICVGCYRSATEITDWFMASSAQRREMLQLAAERRLADDKVQLS